MTNTMKTTKKMTKKEVYAKHGIIFQNDKIVSPVGLIRELLKEGNDKTGKLVLTFSLLPGNGEFTIDINGIEYTVKGTCICKCKGCYAMTGHYNHDTTIRSMAINTYLVNNHIDFVKACIAAQLEYMVRGEVRIHAAGDTSTDFIIIPDKWENLWGTEDEGKIWDDIEEFIYTSVGYKSGYDFPTGQMITLRWGFHRTPSGVAIWHDRGIDW